VTPDRGASREKDKHRQLLIAAGMEISN